MTDIANTERVMNPVTGEVLTLATCETVELAGLRDQIVEFEHQLREAKRAIDGQVLARMDKQALWTMRTGAYQIKGGSPASASKREYDGPALREALMDLVDAGVIGIEAADAAVETVTTYEPHANGIKALRKLGGEVAAAIDAHSSEVETVRRVSVSRAA